MDLQAALEPGEHGGHYVESQPRPLGPIRPATVLRLAKRLEARFEDGGVQAWTPVGYNQVDVVAGFQGPDHHADSGAGLGEPQGIVDQFAEQDAEGLGFNQDLEVLTGQTAAVLEAHPLPNLRGRLVQPLLGQVAGIPPVQGLKLRQLVESSQNHQPIKAAGHATGFFARCLNQRVEGISVVQSVQIAPHNRQRCIHLMGEQLQKPAPFLQRDFLRRWFP